MAACLLSALGMASATGPLDIHRARAQSPAQGAPLRNDPSARSPVVAVPPARPVTARQPSPNSSAQARSMLLQAESWGFQLRALDQQGFAALFYDVLVMDHTRDGAPGTPFTSAELDAIRQKPNGQQRVLLAYLSIGEAETTRYYWKPAWAAKRPAWISHENKERAGNLVVRFWDPQWRQIVYESPDSYLERIIDAGFDGVYLDRVDVYGELERENSNARADMIAFVQALAAKARSLKRDFAVVVQNAEELSSSSEFLAAIDGLAKEDLLHGIDHTATRNAQSTINEAVRHLKHARDRGKSVFVVEHLSKPEQLMSAMREIARYDERFVPHFADRDFTRVRAERSDNTAREDDEDGKKKSQ